MMKEKSWQVSYPEGVVEYLDLFRDKYLQYDVFDPLLHQYIQKYKTSKGNRICSLGAGTGRHEIDMVNFGYDVVGLERDQRSVEIANELFEIHNVSVNMQVCDFLKPEEVHRVCAPMEKFDVIILLFIPISTYDYHRALDNLKQYLNPGGIFITNCFGYREDIDRQKKVLRSDIEVLKNPKNDQMIVRLNYYEFENDIVNWDAIYLVPDEKGNVTMKKDHDILSVCPEEEVKDPIFVDEEEFEILPNYKITECNDSMTPPALYEYLVGRKYRGVE